MIDKTAPRSLDSLIEEGTKFKTLRNEWQRMAYPDQGTPVWIVSKKWIDSYKDYIFYRDIQMGR